MRILFSTTAGSGHFGPMAAIAHACVAAGHKVAVAAPESFADDVARSGFPHRPFADVPPAVLGAIFARLPELSMVEANETVLTEVFGRLDAQAALPGLRSTITAWRPHLVVREPSELGSLAAAGAAGLPQVQVAIGLGDLDRWAFDLLPGPLAELDQLAGLPQGRALDLLRTSPLFTSVPEVLDCVPGSSVARLRPGGPGERAWVHRYRDLPPVADPDLPAAWGRPEDPLVYVTYGSVTGALAQMDGLYTTTLEILADLPVRVLLTTGRGLDPESLRPWPSNARVERWWPQSALMGATDLVVGHGGFGTTMTALAAGVPQVVLPLFAADQFVNAERVAEVGAGLALTGASSALGELSAAVRRVLAEPIFATCATEVATAIAAMPDVGSCVPVLEGLVGAGG